MTGRRHWKVKSRYSQFSPLAVRLDRLINSTGYASSTKSLNMADQRNGHDARSLDIYDMAIPAHSRIQE